MRRSVPTIPLRRKRENKTNYRKRFAYLKSGKNRLVIRLSNKYLTLQIVNYTPAGDTIIKSCVSKELQKLGWTSSCNNLPAAYLTGLLLAHKMNSEENKVCIVDLGLRNPKSGNSKIYAALRGALEGGLDLPVDTKIFPSDDSIIGKHISEDLAKSVEDIKKKIQII